ncbi:hypothetical protein ACWEN6_10285 [Sphaerisporangium sp. NPDC004334]
MVPKAALIPFFAVFTQGSVMASAEVAEGETDGADETAALGGAGGGEAASPVPQAVRPARTTTAMMARENIQKGLSML